MIGHIRTVNLRGDGISIDSDESPVRVDRANPVLGNPFYMARRGDATARAEVITSYQGLLERDLLCAGPMSKQIEDIAKRLNTGENIALQCWCAPLPCHGDVIAKQAKMIAETLREGVRNTEPIKRERASP